VALATPSSNDRQWHFSDLAKCPTSVRKAGQRGHCSGRRPRFYEYSPRPVCGHLRRCLHPRMRSGSGMLSRITDALTRPPSLSCRPSLRRHVRRVGSRLGRITRGTSQGASRDCRQRKSPYSVRFRASRTLKPTSRMTESDPGCVKTHTSAKCRKCNSPTQHRAAYAQHDLTPRCAISSRCFYVRDGCRSFHTAKTHTGHRSGRKCRTAESALILGNPLC
jgi:hypothetical protein